jgi:hypothetical protein
MRLLVLALVLCLFTGIARAEPPEIDPAARAAAQKLFEDGRRLRQDGRWAEALEKFAASQRLDPAVGTLLNVGDCYRQLGRTASAWLSYVDAAGVARRERDQRREDYARAEAAALEPNLARVVVVVDAPAPELAVRLGERAVERAEWGSAVPVDPGKLAVHAAAPGFLPWDGEVVADAGAVARVEIPALEPAPVEPAPVPDEPVVPDEPNPTQRIAGWVLGGVGTLGIGAGIVLAVRARLLDDESQRFCPDDPDTCLPEGADLRAEAQTHERAAIVAMSLGGAALVSGALLLVLAAVDPGGASGLTPLPDGLRIRF